MNEILAIYSNLGCRFFIFSTLNITCLSLLFCSTVKHMGLPLYVTCSFSLAAFNILSLCLIFVVCLGMFLFGFTLYGTLCAFLDLIDDFLFDIGEIFNYNLFKIFLIPFLFLFFF